MNLLRGVLSAPRSLERSLFSKRRRPIGRPFQAQLSSLHLLLCWWERRDPLKPVETGLVWPSFLINCRDVWLINLSYLMQ